LRARGKQDAGERNCPNSGIPGDPEIKVGQIRIPR